MIISYRHRFIFVHCRKVAGSALTAYLNRFLGPADLQVGSWQNALANGGSLNRRFIRDLISPKCLTSLALRTVRKRRINGSMLNNAHKQIYRRALGSDPAHPRATELRSFDPVAWEQHFKFCFVRNPYERVVSDYIWRVQSRGVDVSFRSYLERVADRSKPDPEQVVPRDPDNWPLYTIDGKIAVDFVGRYETLEVDFGEVCERLGLPFRRADLPVAKRKVSDYKYRDWYGSVEKQLVAKIFFSEIEAFEYAY